MALKPDLPLSLTWEEGWQQQKLSPLGAWWGAASDFLQVLFCCCINNCTPSPSWQQVTFLTETLFICSTLGLEKMPAL